MKKLNLILFLASAAAFLPALLIAQDINKKADSLLSEYYKYDLFTGTVLIANNNKILFEKSYGYANRNQQILIHDDQVS